MNRMLRSLFALGLVVAVFGPRARVNATAGYTIVDLGTLGATESEGDAINGSGQIMGLTFDAGGVARTFLYSDGVMSDIGSLGYDTWGWAMNDSGEVVGRSTRTDTFGHAFLYSSGAMTDLGTLIGGTYSEAHDINATGQVTGYSDTPTTFRAFLYSNGVMTDLGTVPGKNSSNAVAINAAGQVTGWAGQEDSMAHAFLYKNGAMIDLTPNGGEAGARGAINDLGQVTGGVYALNADGYFDEHVFLYDGTVTDLGKPSWASHRARGLILNNTGQIAGIADTFSYDSKRHAFFYSNGIMTDLGTFGGSESHPNAMNNAGQVTGWAFIAGDTERHAFLYSAGAMTDLNTLIPADSGWTLVEAMAINDKGQITGIGRINGQSHAFLLMPIVAAVPPTITKAFGTNTIPLGTNTSLTFTLQNPNATSLSGIGFTDALPLGVIVANPPGLTGSCAGIVTAVPNSSSVVLSAGSLAGNATCSFSVMVTGNSIGTWNNVTENVTSNEGGAGTTASATLMVGPPLPNCQGLLTSAYAQQYGSLANAAAALGYGSVKALQDALKARCGIF